MKNDSMATNSNTEISVERFFPVIEFGAAQKWWKWQIKNHLDFQDVETIRIESDKKRKGTAEQRENNKEQNKKNELVKIFFSV